MARSPEGWSLVWKPAKGGPIAHVRFRLKKRRHEETTGTRDPKQAAEIAATIYADFVSGRVRRDVHRCLIHPGTELDGVGADWIADIEPELGPETGNTYAIYVGHWSAAMPTIRDVSSAGIGNYQRERLRKVQRETVVKERTALRRFLVWCVEQEKLAEVPLFPDLPKKATGQKHKQGRGKPAQVLSVEEVEAILGELKESRDFFVVLFETGLRPEGTVERLERADLTPFGLHIRPECDKNRNERVIPVSERARAALERGLPFGPMDRRAGFAGALKRALGDGRKATAYDLKHARITYWVDGGMELGGISFLTGVSIETLTKRYAHPTRKAAERVVFGGNSGAAKVGASCEGRDSNPQALSSASTSIESGPQDLAEKMRLPDEESAEKSRMEPLSGALHPNPVTSFDRA